MATNILNNQSWTSAGKVLTFDLGDNCEVNQLLTVRNQYVTECYIGFSYIVYREGRYSWTLIESKVNELDCRFIKYCACGSPHITGLYLDLCEDVLHIKIHYILSKVLYLLSKNNTELFITYFMLNSTLWKGN